MHVPVTDRGSISSRGIFRLARSPRSALFFLTRIAILLGIVAGLLALTVETGISLAASPSTSSVSVLTYKYDNGRSGENPNETILNTSNVNATTFGKRVSYPVDGPVYAEPLFMPNLTIKGKVHNVVFVETENGSVYAFDADKTKAASPLWKTRFTNSTTIKPYNGHTIQCSDLGQRVSITGTPVIDPATDTMYLVAETVENGQYVNKLHALNILTGQDVPGSPVVISASVPGNGVGSINGVVTFDPEDQLQRPGLALVNGVVYIAWGSFCDHTPAFGWLMGYNETTLQQVGVYNTNANGSLGSIWQSGVGISADADNNLYVMSGNGVFDLNSGGVDAGDSFVKLSTSGGLSVSDYFTPFNQKCLNEGDVDLGSGGPLLLPNQDELIGVGKEGRIYVVNRDNMGKYTQIKSPCYKQNLTNVDKILQEFPPKTTGEVYSSSAYWNGSSGQFVYFASMNRSLMAYSLTNGLLSATPTSETPEKFSFPGGNPVVSSNGTNAGTGIVWIIDPSGFLRAYDATNLATELYNTGQNPTRDSLPSTIKFSVPTIANGEVFVGTKTTLEIYGLLG
jgi:hypothetical protein